MWRTIALRVVVGLMATIIVLVLALLFFDWNLAKPWLNARISEAVQRPFSINGDLSLLWERNDATTGWRAWIPVPHLRAADIEVGNPSDMQAKEPFAQVSQLRFSLYPLPLLTRDIVIPDIYLDQAKLHLLRNKDDRNNWTLRDRDPDKKSAWEVHIGDVQFRNGEIHLNDALQEIDATAQINTLPPAQHGTFRTNWKVSGHIQGERLSGEGRSGALLALRDQHTPFPLEASLKAGETALSAEGNVTGIPSFERAELKLSLSGNSMAHLYPILGILLPHTPQFSTHGNLHKSGSIWRYQDFSGKVGQSDLAGDLTVDLAGPRPRLRGELVSRLLRFEDLGPLAGGGNKKNLASDDKTRKQPEHKVLPVREFNTKKWRTLDADVRFRAKRILRSEDLPFEDMVTHLKLEDGVMSLSPLNFGVAGGELNSDVKLDGSKDIIQATVDLSARGLKLNELFPAIKEMDASLGVMSAGAKLTSQGNSLSQMLGASNGEIKALISEGTVSKLLLEAVGLDISSLVVTKLFGDRQVQLHCMAAVLGVEKGIMFSRGFLIDTPESLIHVNGDVNLAKEELNVRIQSESKKFELISLRSRIFVRGKFDDPQISVDEEAIAAQAGGALLLGLAAPVAAALLPLINLGEGEDKNDNRCYQLLQKAQTNPKAPPAEKSGR